MTRQNQIVEQVARIIATHLERDEAYGGEPFTRSDAERVNRTSGWSFDVRWRDGEYVSHRDWTRVEGEQLSAADLNRAWALAEQWAAER